MRLKIPILCATVSVKRDLGIDLAGGTARASPSMQTFVKNLIDLAGPDAAVI